MLVRNDDGTWTSDGTGATRHSWLIKDKRMDRMMIKAMLLNGDRDPNYSQVIAEAAARRRAKREELRQAGIAAAKQRAIDLGIWKED